MNTLAVEITNGDLDTQGTYNGPQFDLLVSEVDALSGSIEEQKVESLGITLVEVLMDRLDYGHDGGFDRPNSDMKIQAV